MRLLTAVRTRSLSKKQLVGDAELSWLRKRADTEDGEQAVILDDRAAPPSGLRADHHGPSLTVLATLEHELSVHDARGLDLCLPPAAIVVGQEPSLQVHPQKRREVVALVRRATLALAVRRAFADGGDGAQHGPRAIVLARCGHGRNQGKARQRDAQTRGLKSLHRQSPHG